MTTEREDSLKGREAVLMLLTDAEIARVSNMEMASTLREGEEFLDLAQLDKGVQRAGGKDDARLTNIIPRHALSAETWERITATLAAGYRN